MTRTLSIVVACFLLASGVAHGQTRRPTAPPPRRPAAPKKPRRVDRGFVTVGGLLQVTPLTIADTAHPIDFGERATIDTRFHAAALPGFDVTAGFHIRRRLGIAAGASFVARSSDAPISAQVPYPFLFGRPRSVTGQASLARREFAVHVQPTWTTTMGRRWQLTLGAGPSIFHVSQEVVDDITVSQTYPFDTATFDRAAILQRGATGVGVNGGAALDRPLSRAVALRVGGTLSYASLGIGMPDGRRVSTSAGGGRVGAALLIRF